MSVSEKVAKKTKIWFDEFFENTSPLVHWFDIGYKKNNSNILIKPNQTQNKIPIFVFLSSKNIPKSGDMDE